MIKAGIVDPAKVTRSALQNAASIGGMILTTECLVTDKPEEKKDMPPMPASLGMMTHNKTGSWRNVRPVINYEKCINCFICWKFLS